MGTELNEVVMNLQIELKNAQEELEVVKTEMEERSSTVTDTAPIVKMKDSFKRLRADTRQLEVRIGVVSHTLMQAKLRQRPQEDRGVHVSRQAVARMSARASPPLGLQVLATTSRRVAGRVRNIRTLRHLWCG